MRRSDVIVLIAPVPSDTPADAVNENGFPVPREEARTTVFGSKKSSGHSEFYKADEAGYKVDLKFVVYTEEYEGQPLAELDGKRYRILKTYLGGNRNSRYKHGSEDFTELTLCDLSERGGEQNGAV